MTHLFCRTDDRLMTHVDRQYVCTHISRSLPQLRSPEVDLDFLSTVFFQLYYPKSQA